MSFSPLCHLLTQISSADYENISACISYNNNQMGNMNREQLLRISVPRIRLHMMTSSNGNIFRVTGHLCGKFTGPR